MVLEVIIKNLPLTIWCQILATLKYYILKHIIVQRNILLAVQNSSVLENLACITKIRFTLKSLLIRYRGGFFFFLHVMKCFMDIKCQWDLHAICINLIKPQ